jgi:Peptidase family M28
VGGMAAFLRAHRTRLISAPRVLVLSLDTLGAGTPIVAAGEGTILEHRYRPVDLALADAGAARAGEPAPERWCIGGWTDPVLARFAGPPAISLLSMGPGHLPDYHRPTDTPDRVDWACAARWVRIAKGIADAFARAPVSVAGRR